MSPVPAVFFTGLLFRSRILRCKMSLFPRAISQMTLNLTQFTLSKLYTAQTRHENKDRVFHFAVIKEGILQKKIK